MSVRLPKYVQTDDLVSAGMAALAAAARAFDDTLGVPFERYAALRIHGALLDELRAADWAPRSLRAKVRKRDAVDDSLTAELGRRPTEAELAAALGLTVTDLRALATRLHASLVLRLDGITRDGDADTMLPPTKQTPEAVLVARERLAYLRDAVDVLPARLRTVIRGCFFGDRSTAEMGVELGVNGSRVSQMRGEALELLRDGMNSQLDPGLLPKARKTVGATARRRAAYFARVAARSTYRQRLAVT